MDVYLDSTEIQDVFQIIIDNYQIFESEYKTFFASNIRLSIKKYFDDDNELIIYDELDNIEIEESLNGITHYYQNSFREENHNQLIFFIQHLLYKLGKSDEISDFVAKLTIWINRNNLILANKDYLFFVCDEELFLDDEVVYLNSFAMSEYFDEQSKTDMVIDRIKDALFLFNNERYVGSLALSAFALEGYLRGIYKDKYEEVYDDYKLINATLMHQSRNEVLIKYSSRAMPSTELKIENFPTPNSINIGIKKIKASSSSSTVGLKLRNEYEGLICHLEKEEKRVTKDNTLERLIETAKLDNLIDDKTFIYDSFNTLRKIRNRIVHFDTKHTETIHQDRAKRILLKVIDFINLKLYQ